MGKSIFFKGYEWDVKESKTHIYTTERFDRPEVYISNL